MGTSKSYKGYVGNPKWRTLSTSVTGTSNSVGLIPNQKVKNILSNYVSFIGGSKISGGGSSKIFGKAGINTAQKFANVVTLISSQGFDKAMQEIGLIDFKDKTPNEILAYILEYSSGPAALLDETAAKSAEKELLLNICANAEDIDNLEKNFKEYLNEHDINDILIQYFTNYIYEHLSQAFEEKLIKEKGLKKYGNLFSQIKKCLYEEIRILSKKTDLKNINWSKKQGENIIKEIFTEILNLFE
jgi:hypothetical protein